MTEPEPRRIGSPAGFFTIGGVLVLITVFAVMAGDGSAARGIGSFAAALFFIGFWVELFGKIEQRLIDIEGKISREPVPVGEPAPDLRSSD